MLLAPSIISADFARLEAHCREALDAGADWLPVDVMDGKLVPNITIDLANVVLIALGVALGRTLFG